MPFGRDHTPNRPLDKQADLDTPLEIDTSSLAGQADEREQGLPAAPATGYRRAVTSNGRVIEVRAGKQRMIVKTSSLGPTEILLTEALRSLSKPVRRF